MAKFTKYTGSDSGKTFYKLTMGPKEASEFATAILNAHLPLGNNVNNVVEAITTAIFDEVVPEAEYAEAKVG